MNTWQSALDPMMQKDGQQKNVYSYGEHSVELARQYYTYKNTADDGYNGTCAVNAFGPQNAYGFYNMVGNVWEWTSTPWVPSHPNAAPVTPDNMVKKGGSFLCNKATCNRFRTSARMMFTKDSAATNVGFRCAYPAKDDAAAAGESGSVQGAGS